MRNCLRRIADVGVKVVSITCDGPSCHFVMLSKLGACLSPTNLITWFSHPSNSGEKICFIRHVPYVEGS